MTRELIANILTRLTRCEVETPTKGSGRKIVTWKWLPAFGVLAIFPLAGAYVCMTRTPPAAEAQTAEPRQAEPAVADAVHVQVQYPDKRGVERTTTQPGSVHSFESVDLYAGVSGYLKRQPVDIGDRIKKGQVLATVDVPDLDKQVERDRAAVNQARARVEVMNARVTSAKADLEAAKAAVKQAQATARSKTAERRYRDQQLARYQNLKNLTAIDARMVDEETEHRDAALEAEFAATAAIATAQANEAAAQAKIKQAESDVLEAKAEVGVAQANLDKTLVLTKYAVITAPFDGVITRRNFFPNDYIDAANTGPGHIPLLNVQRTDLFRVVVQVPDRDAPFCHFGNRATVQFETLGKSFPGKVSRISYSEDPETRLMHIEIDLHNNAKGEIKDGMYGHATIFLDSTGSLAVPSSALVGKAEGGQGKIYVVRDGHAHLTPVVIGSDNGIKTSIVSGLSPEDLVVIDPGSSIEDGVAVVAEHVDS
jgi:HlyD family secretion protein